MAFCQSACRSW